MDYTKLLSEAENLSLIVKDKPLHAYDGRIKGNRIALRQDMSEVQKKCVLAEELGHYCTTVGDILDQTTITNRKQEYRARLWGYNKLIGLQGIVASYKAGCSSLYDMADFLDVTEDFLAEALQCYSSKFGVCTSVDNYTIYFHPHLMVLEIV